MEILGTPQGRLAALVTRLLQCLLRNKTHEEFWGEVAAEWGLLGSRVVAPAKKGKIRNGERAEWEFLLRARLAELKALPFLELMRKLAVERWEKQKWLGIMTEEMEAEVGRPALALFGAAGFAPLSVFYERCTNPHEVPRRDKALLRASMERVVEAIKATDLSPQRILHGMLQNAEKEMAFLAARRGWTWERILRELLSGEANAEAVLGRVPNLGEVYSPAVCAKVVAAVKAPKAAVELEKMSAVKFNQWHRAREMGTLVKKVPRVARTLQETLVNLLERLPNARGCVERAMAMEGPLTAGQILSAILRQMKAEFPAGDVAETQLLFGMVEDQDGYVVLSVFPADFAGFFKLAAPFFEDKQVEELKKFVGPAGAALEEMKRVCGKKEVLDNMFQRVDPTEMVLPAPDTFVGFATAALSLAAQSGKMAEFEQLNQSFSGNGAEYAEALKVILCPEHVARLYAGVLDTVILN